MTDERDDIEPEAAKRQSRLDELPAMPRPQKLILALSLVIERGR